MRLSDPHAELPIKNHKYVKNCTELYLSNRQIDKLAHFEAFVNLEVLWINDNQIASLDGLDECFRIKYLFAQNNRIRSLKDSSLLSFKFLRELRLNDNRLSNLDETLEVLGKLHHLEDLDLFGNPIVEEESYRLQVIHAVPSLLVLDRHVITDIERVQAERFRIPSQYSQDESRRTKKKAIVARAPPQQMSGTVKILFREVAAIQKEQQVQEQKAIERELLELSRTQQQMLINNSASTRPMRASVIANVDDWELSSLKKFFHSLEEKPNSGIPKEKLRDIWHYLHTCGYIVSFFDGYQIDVPIMESNTTSRLSDLFPSQDKIQWTSLVQCFERKQLQCKYMTPKILRQSAANCFEKARTLQSRLQSITVGDPRLEQLVREIHDLSQQGYRFQTLAEKLTPDTKAISTSERSELPSGNDLSRGGPTTANMCASKTRFYITKFVRDTPALPSPSSLLLQSEQRRFDELREECAQAETALATKYKLHNKDFVKYLLKQTSHPTKLVRHNYHL